MKSPLMHITRILLGLSLISCGKATMPILGLGLGIASGVHAVKAYSGETLARNRGAAELNCLPERVEVRSRGSELYDVECAYRIATVACRTDGSHADRHNFCWVESRRDVEGTESNPEPTADVAVQSPEAKRRRTLQSIYGGAAVRIQTKCGGAKGPKGMGKATFTVQPDGTTTDVHLDAVWDREEVGLCIRGEFLRTVVPSFDGEAIRVSKAFSLLQ